MVRTMRRSRARYGDTRLEIVTGTSSTAFVHVEASIDKIPRAGRGRSALPAAQQRAPPRRA